MGGNVAVGVLLEQLFTAGQPLEKILVWATTFMWWGWSAWFASDFGLDAVRARLLAIAFDLAILTVHTGQYLGGFGVGWRRGDGVCR